MCAITSLIQSSSRVRLLYLKISQIEGVGLEIGLVKDLGKQKNDVYQGSFFISSEAKRKGKDIDTSKKIQNLLYPIWIPTIH